jgi:hypothetical protein
MFVYKKIAMAMVVAGALITGSLGYAMEESAPQEQTAVQEQDSVSMGDIALPIVSGVASGVACNFFAKVIIAGIVTGFPVNLITGPLGLAFGGVGIECLSSLKNSTYSKIFKNKNKAEALKCLDALTLFATMITL